MESDIYFSDVMIDKALRNLLTLQVVKPGIDLVQGLVTLPIHVSLSQDLLGSLACLGGSLTLLLSINEFLKHICLEVILNH